MEAISVDFIGRTCLVSACLCFIIQAIYYLTLYPRIIRRQRSVASHPQDFSRELPPVSIILYSRDEVDQMRRNLPLLLTQDYPCYEVIVINDGPIGESDDFLTQLEQEHRHLYHSFIPDSSRYISRKKLALTLGMRAAKYDWLLMTEVDCRPVSDQWLRLMARNFTPQTQVVLGYSRHEDAKGLFRSRVAYDNLFGSMRYLGMALAGHPYMGIGRNLAYRKSLFLSRKGFSTYLTLERGDDDLFINQVANGHNTRVETDAQAVMKASVVTRKKDWREEKIGYTVTSALYRGSSKYLLSFETMTRLLFHLSWIACVVLSLLQRNWVLAGTGAGLFLMRFALQATIINRTAKALGEQRRYWLSLPVYDVLQPLQSLRWKLYCLLHGKQEFLRK